MAIRSDEIISIIKSQIESFDATTETRSVGTVVEVGDGIAQIYGLDAALASEMLEFPGGVMGLALNLEEETVGAVILGDPSAIKEGDQVRTTGRVVEVPGRRGAARAGSWTRWATRSTARATSRARRPVRSSASPPASSPASRWTPRSRRASRPIDALIPIGRGQRELIIGDRQTGKTAIAIDTIINQKGGDLVCIYVAIGQKLSTVAQTVATLEKYGAMEHTIVVVAGAEDPAPLQYLAPYAGVAMGEEIMENGVEVGGRADQGRPVRLRRPVEARLGVPRDVAAAPPPARPRGVPGRRVLPPQPAARARRAHERRERRRLADGAADHRDPGQRRVGVHPDQRDLDHRRPDLPRDRPVQRRPAARDEHRHLGVARRLGGPDQGHEEGRRPAQARPRAVPRAGGVRAVRERPGQGDPRPAEPGREAVRDHRSSRSTSRCRSRSRSRSWSPPRAASSTTSRRPRSRTSRPGSTGSSRPSSPQILDELGKTRPSTEELLGGPRVRDRRLQGVSSSA